MTTAGIASHQPLLWSLAYRITGSSADADEIAQEALLRALEHAPREPRPWLVRVACNLARDRLRRRRRQRYVGPWLPDPVRLPDDDVGDRESASMAWLLAAEALTPAQRAVVVLRDVFEQNTAEVAETLGMSEGNVRVTHHRARRALSGRVPMGDPAAHQVALMGFLSAVAAGDVAGARRWLADDAVALSDGGGEVNAAGVAIVGADKVTKAFMALASHRQPDDTAELVSLNGWPAVKGLQPGRTGRWPERWYLQVVLDGDGKIGKVLNFLAPSRLWAAP